VQEVCKHKEGAERRQERKKEEKNSTEKMPWIRHNFPFFCLCLCFFFFFFFFG